MASTTVADCMTPTPTSIDVSDTIQTAAQTMSTEDVGALVVRDGGQTVGIVTDRDLVVRGLARGLGGDSSIQEVTSKQLVVVGPDDQIGTAVQKMRDAAVRRVLVMDRDDVVGIVSLGDLAVDRDPTSALADISEAPPNR